MIKLSYVLIFKKGEIGYTLSSTIQNIDKGRYNVNSWILNKAGEVIATMAHIPTSFGGKTESKYFLQSTS